MLLKNRRSAKHNRDVLPLHPAAHRVTVVVGPHVDATVAMIENYMGKPCRYTTPLQGVAAYATRVVQQAGCTDVACRGNQPIAAAIEAARQADATIVVAGLDQNVEVKGLDRTC
jgi:xylan 1,4-beta-xylosidase